MNECLFCRFVKKEIATEIVFENEIALAFLDILPRAPGHTMVIPKRHAQNISELPDDLVGPFFQTTKKVIAQIDRALHPDGFTLGMNYGKASGQEVQHLHFHIIPRWHGDGGGPIQRVVSNEPKENIKVIAQRIR
jgi:histidine triad (HIT) family protein